MFKDLREIMTVKSEQMWSVNRKTKATKKEQNENSRTTTYNIWSEKFLNELKNRL